MLILDLASSLDSEEETDQLDNYPEEVLESEWNPVLAEIHSLQPSGPGSTKPDPEVIKGALAQLYRSL